jgi:Protein of unknown function (DUF3592)
MRYYFGGVGAVMLLIGCWLTIKRISILMSGVRTTGRIETYQLERDGMDGTEYYFPVVSFEDENGQAHRFTSTSGVLSFRSRRPSAGKTVAIIYSRENPAQAIIASFIGTWGAPLTSAVLGGVALLVSCCGN